MVWRKKNSLANRNGMGKLTQIPSWLHAARLASVSVSPSSTKSWAAWRFENGTPFWVLFPWPWVLSPFLQFRFQNGSILGCLKHDFANVEYPIPCHGLQHHVSHGSIVITWGIPVYPVSGQTHAILGCFNR